MTRRLTAEAEARIAAFERSEDYRCCSCHIATPCAWCTHPDNPHNVHEEDDAWEDEPEPVDYLGAARSIIKAQS